MTTKPGVRTFADRDPKIRRTNQDIVNAGYPYLLVPRRFPITDDFTKWCNAQFGYKHWVNRNNLREHVIFFSKEEDKTAFILRWQNDFEF